MSGRVPWARAAEIFLRVALAASFLSAVADRFGLWGSPGAPGVAWGAWGPFVDYTATINPLVPTGMVPALAWTATLAEVAIALGLLVGWRLRWFAAAGGALLSLFAFAMATSVGLKPPLDYSVFSVAAAAFVLACSPRARA
ncbi:DoxX family protein [Haliangium sp.]|uniref:DoxX family protein n=1 Tax=Haliangium sp. TaxID=2663208 RepID=UPI003D0BBBB9